LTKSGCGAGQEGCETVSDFGRLASCFSGQRLHLPETGGIATYPNLSCILARPIDWALVEQQYDEFVRYTTAMAERTADPETILRRFTRANVQHPPYKGLAELGKAVKTIFLCRYLRG
jgi:TnpA family transposase